MHTNPSHGFGTRAIHAGQTPDPSTGAICTPIYQTSTFVQKSPGVIVEEYDYSRAANPTRTALEANIASLEGAEHGLAFSSGVAATGAVIHLLSAGDHVVLCDDVYGGTNRIFHRVFAQLGIEITLVDMTDLEATKAAFQPNTKLVWIETPTNPMLKIVDIPAVTRLAREHGAITAVDNTFCSPYLQNPLSLGADIVCHSTTKYIGGHSDAIGGVLAMNDPNLHKRLKFIQLSEGAVPGIQECFLFLRSTKTLHVRMDRHCDNAMRIAKHLEQHPKVERVIYPGLESHPQHAVARKQMRAFGGMVTIYLKGGLAESRAMLEKVKIFALAESLGGVESLIEHPAIMTHASVPADQRAKLGIADNLVRLSVGIEDCNDLIADLDQAIG
ncbi:MAG: cystathionine gamma-synthase [Phycisphaerales bacterium]|nr:cystathionine gamma-synthase [Planctomycetota bacterium]MCH8507971.1 cystathionine gamma-synthase [Phycisphaerales bacterium]